MATPGDVPRARHRVRGLAQRALRTREGKGSVMVSERL